MEPLQLSIGCDHAGFDYKDAIIAHLSEQGHTVQDFGTYSTDSVDYPDFVHPVAESIEKGNAQLGILLCGSANGVAITANKHKTIRAAIVWQNDLAALARQHNDANVICLPARFISQQNAIQFVDTFLQSTFEGGRHQQRVNKMIDFC
jgi:ribose 5-phosphate isomerase B